VSDDQGEKTEQATDAKRDEYRKRGQVAMTRELGTAAIILLSAGMLYFMGRFFLVNITEIFEKCMSDEFLALAKDEHSGEIFFYLGYKLLVLLGPLFFISVVVGVASQVMQTGFLQVEDALSPDLNKLNPLTALGRIFSMKGLAELFKSLLKIMAVFLVMYLLLKSEVKQIPYLSGYTTAQILTYLGGIIFKLFLGTGMFMLVLSLADYFFQRWQLEKEMMMSKQEIKEEHKSREGDPLIKARVRKIQREIANRKMLTEIPKANVVITNPTHIACVLKYSDKLPAPQLVAMGADFMAEKIKEIARQHNIPVIENKPLARTIFKTMKIGQIIPRELFTAVAEVLSYVMRLNRKKAKRKPTQNRNPNRDKGL
jgi:flagellar biosynthesis protein FlhB